jgi:hypothetical protein
LRREALQIKAAVDYVDSTRTRVESLQIRGNLF